MTEEIIRKYINQGEGLKVEFKLAQKEMPSDLFETICAFLNRSGGVNVPVNVPVNDAINDTIDEAINDAVRDTVSDALKKRLIKELIHIIFNKEVKLKVLCERFTIQEKTAKRDMALLKKFGFVEFRGAPKTGHYVITDKVKKLKLKKR